MNRRRTPFFGAPARHAAAGAGRVPAVITVLGVLAMLLAALLAARPAGAADAPPAPPASRVAGDPGRGQLLYETHCRACHSTQMHWRDNRRVQDWASLLAQVRQWQSRAHLGWTDDDVQAVARHLNDHIYRLPAPEQRAALGPTRRDTRAFWR